MRKLKCLLAICPQIFFTLTTLGIPIFINSFKCHSYTLEMKVLNKLHCQTICRTDFQTSQTEGAVGSHCLKEHWPHQSRKATNHLVSCQCVFAVVVSCAYFLVFARNNFTFRSRNTERYEKKTMWSESHKQYR